MRENNIYVRDRWELLPRHLTGEPYYCEDPTEEKSAALVLEFFKKVPGFDTEEVTELVTKGITVPGYLESLYRITNIPKKNGGRRVIEAPAPLLKKVQRAILDAFVYPFLPVSRQAHGFRPRRGIKTNAAAHYKQEHKGSQVLLKMDLHNFFPSIPLSAVTKEIKNFFLYRARTGRDIPLPDIPAVTAPLLEKGERKVSYWGKVKTYGYSLYGRRVAESLYLLTEGLARLCTFRERLPQGAPTSPALANVVMAGFDSKAMAALERMSADPTIEYTRYADDIIVSALNTWDVFMAKHLLERMVLSTGYLVINPEKVCILRNNLPQRVTGININEKLSVSRYKRDNIRAEIHNLVTGKTELRDGQLARLAGYRAFMRHVDEAGWDSRCEKGWKALQEKLRKEAS